MEEDQEPDDFIDLSEVVKPMRYYSGQESSDRAQAPGKAQHKAKKKAVKAEAAQQAENRPFEEVELKNLTSISGPSGGKSRNVGANIECHACGEKGHKKADCPNRGSKRKSGFKGSRQVKKVSRMDDLDY